MTVPYRCRAAKHLWPLVEKPLVVIVNNTLRRSKLSTCHRAVPCDKHYKTALRRPVAARDQARRLTLLFDAASWTCRTHVKAILASRKTVSIASGTVPPRS